MTDQIGLRGKILRVLSSPLKSSNSPIAFCAVLTISACSSPQKPSDTEPLAAETHVPAHEYAQRDGDAFMYVGALSDEAKARGENAAVITFRYLGQEGDVQRLQHVDDAGSPLGVYECSSPCRVAKSTTAFGQVTRVAIEPKLILAAAFRDAANGFLTPVDPQPQKASQRAIAPVVRTSRPVNAPAETDTRGAQGKCILAVRGVSYITDACRIRLEGDGSFQIMSLDERYFAQLSRSGNDAYGFWNETPGSSHAQSALGSMQRAGACWKNADAEICAWSHR